MRTGLPSPPALADLAVLMAACEAEPPRRGPAALPDVYLEKLQEAKAASYSMEPQTLERQRLERLNGSDQAGSAVRRRSSATAIISNASTTTATLPSHA